MFYHIRCLRRPVLELFVICWELQLQLELEFHTHWWRIDFMGKIIYTSLLQKLFINNKLLVKISVLKNLSKTNLNTIVEVN